MWVPGLHGTDKYCNKFVSLSCRDTTLTEPQQVRLFITDLGNPLRTDVALIQPTTLANAVVFTQAYVWRLHPRHHADTTLCIDPLHHEADDICTGTIGGKLDCLVSGDCGKIGNNPAIVASRDHITTPDQDLFLLQ
jgi:hypothetical protein